MTDRKKMEELLKQAMTINDPRSGNTEFLTKEDKEKSTVEKLDRENSARRPCSNCTCGRKEQQTKVVTKSACGNCHKGDAFRCAGCPSLGLPPYKPGESVNFNSVDDDI